MHTIQCPASNDTDYHKFTFAAGEPHIILSKYLLEDSGWYEPEVNIEFNFSRSEDIFELLLLANTLWGNDVAVNQLILPYMPFGQADRVNEPGECFSLRLFCIMVNNIIQAKEVIVYDPHSDVTPALLNNCTVVEQWELFLPILRQFQHTLSSDFYLISPDAGASKKIYKTLKHVMCCGVIQCDKIRNTVTGEITGTNVYCEDFEGMDAVIIDDICIGGRTYTEIAKIMHQRNCGKLFLYTTNGIYSKGLGVFDGLIDQIWNRKGRVK